MEDNSRMSREGGEPSSVIETVSEKVQIREERGDLR